MEPSYSIDLDYAEDMGYIVSSESPETNLWRAVLVRAIKDAIGIDEELNRNIAAANQRGAQRWLYEGGRDFKRVCLYAGLEPESVQLAALDFITSPAKDNRSLRRKGSHSGVRAKQIDSSMVA